jgi:hypothetical protein
LPKKFSFESLPPEKLAWLEGLFQSEGEFFMDIRVHSKSGDPDYTPPPPCPYVKIEMIEADLIKHVGELMGQNTLPQKRLTSAGNQVYRVNTQSRAKVEAFLRTILPYVIGERKRGEIEELLVVCDAYNQWILDGGHRKAAQLAARIKAQKQKEKKQKEK